MTEKKATYIVVGKIGAPYGIHGWLKIHSFTSPSAGILSYKPWYLSKKTTGPLDWTKIEREDSKQHGTSLIIKFADIATPEEARLLTGASIGIERSQLPPLKQNEYYWSDLIGLKVINRSGEELGEVIYLLATGSNDVLVIKKDKEFAIPFLLDEVILSIDLIKKEMIVDWELL